MDHSAMSIDLNSFSIVENPSTLNSMQLQTTDFSKYLRKIAGIDVPYLPGTVICIGFDLIFTLITLVMGGSNFSSCPIEKRIPIYLVVVSTVNLTMISLTIIGCYFHVKKKDDNLFGFFVITLSAIIIIILQIFCFIWLILGTVWTYSILNEVQYTQTNIKTYCQGSVYRYTLISIILQYIIPIVLCCCKNVSSTR
ncbi:unnamed protein product [Rotaria sp. Silwood2]|nr:unnamed protein product [Rotaria sp. Silwood2]CAF2622068.1 unnamed protein product [Rotaria sp. Silwood2]CAF2861023.1 unnamed protein product [Rotaria sp. Silwood2]CAF3028248.1 unnamed protein product [Rotaria sp. Silwood2]CAF4249080.1 unnamed protein product [Rotaria sp. Silwood2]